jgi:HEAT repeats/PBS lyase HEAT-like repeat
MPPPEPRFQGKPLRFWLVENAIGTSDWREITNAFYQIGPKAVPYVGARLRKDNSWTARHYRDTWPRMPMLLKRVLPKPREPLPEVVAVNAFTDIGPAAIPLLSHLCKDPCPSVRSSATWALGALQRRGYGDEISISSLVSSLTDQDAHVRRQTADTLGGFGPKAAAAVLGLVERLKDDDKGTEPGSVVLVRAAAARSLERIGPSAKAAVPALSSLAQDPDLYTHMEARIALWRIERRNVLPALLEDLARTADPSKWEILEVLAQMGSGAKSAAEAIRSNLSSRNPEVRQRAAEALWRIDPEEAPVIVEALVEPMNDPGAIPFSLAEGARMLGQMGARASNAVPALVKLLSHRYASNAAALALEQINGATRR